MGLKNILDSLEHRISKLEDRTKENTQSEVYSLQERKMAERHRKENREHREWRIQRMCKWNIRRQRQTERGLTNV